METTLNIKHGYKKTPVGIIPEDWEVKKFEDCFKQLKTYTFSREQLTYEKDKGNFYNIHYGDIHATFPKNLLDTEKDLSLIPIIKNTEIENPELLQNGDLIMADASEDYDGVGASVELINIGNKKIVSGTHTFALRPKKKFAPKYAGYIFSNFNSHKQLKRIATGISVFGLSKSNISKVKLPIPPLPEQKSIAACLSTWDKGIEKLSALIEAKKQQKKGLMQQLFNGQLTINSEQLSIDNGQLSMNNVQLKRVENEEDWLKGWKEVRLGDFFKERNETGFNNLELLSIGEIGVYPQSISNKKDTSNEDKSKYKLIEKGDIGYNTMRLWQGRLAFSSLRGIVSPAYTIVIPKKDKSNSKFFSYFFKMPFVIFKFYRNSQGMVSDTLQCRFKDFKNIKVKVPGLEEQTAIAEVLSTADKEIELLEKKLEAMKMQKKGLMQVLLTGEKRIIN